MDLEELLSSGDLSAIQGRDFGPGCFSISSFFTFLQVGHIYGYNFYI